MGTGTTKRRVIVETNNGGPCPDQKTITYEQATGVYRALDNWLSSGNLPFLEPVEGEDSYREWDRLTINISPPICQAEGGDCWNWIDREDEQATQICLDCQDKAQGGEE